MKALLPLVMLSLLLFGVSPAWSLEGEVLYGQALSASREGDFVRALPLWNSVLEVLPEDPAALSNRGNVRLAQQFVGDETRCLPAVQHAPAGLLEAARGHRKLGWSVSDDQRHQCDDKRVSGRVRR